MRKKFSQRMFCTHILGIEHNPSISQCWECGVRSGDTEGKRNLNKLEAHLEPVKNL